eukprot:CAMPEP_0172594168 /NCGR_PEP_ID=MMETSP1068-20121228/13500_1 /TAXON_ID=35684 /ORGANISM="Pseudopedinella elastica, Strain CCMP716" /LENGTH=122 /DNA_ID=CAMNT_0013392043 /DNA_START=692 /DNA_END=1056 /DNA_ORIENTATION=+
MISAGRAGRGSLASGVQPTTRTPTSAKRLVTSYFASGCSRQSELRTTTALHVSATRPRFFNKEAFKGLASSASETSSPGMLPGMLPESRRGAASSVQPSTRTPSESSRFSSSDDSSDIFVKT